MWTKTSVRNVVACAAHMISVMYQRLQSIWWTIGVIEQRAVSPLGKMPVSTHIRFICRAHIIKMVGVTATKIDRQCAGVSPAQELVLNGNNYV
jgi:hypothetical protein